MKHRKYFIFLQKRFVFVFLFFILIFSFLSVPEKVYSDDFLYKNFSITYPISALNSSSGDIIVKDRYTNTFRLSITEDSPFVFGVVAEEPMLVFRTSLDSIPIMRFGETGVNVILEDGGIRAGDYITTSRIMGYGQAVKPHHQYIVGIAVEDFLEKDAEDFITMPDGRGYPVGKVRVDLRVSIHGSGVLKIPYRDFEGEYLEMGARQMFNDNINTLRNMGEGVLDGTRDFMGTPEGNVISKIASIGGVIAGTFSFIAAFFISPLTVFEIFLLPLRLWALTLSFFGIKRRSRPWGVVYDSVTKQPIDPAYVQLEDENGNEIKMIITDLDGRYGFLPEPGKYRIKANKTNYVFPSEKLKGKRFDNIYNDLYFGEVLSINDKNTVLSKNIPMDAIGFDWNEFAKSKKGMMSYYSSMDFFKAVVFKWLFYVGFAVAVLALFLIPSVYNIVIVSLYVLLFFVRLFGVKTRKYGKVIEDTSGSPMSYAIVRICLAKVGREVSKAVCDKHGRYFALASDGDYYVNIDKKVGEDEYEMVYTSESFKVKNGIINRNFRV